MNLEPLNTVILAEDYAKLRDWYLAALDLELKQEWTQGYHYAELVRGGKHVVGIAVAKEMGCEPYAPRRNTAILQLQTDDIETLFARIREHGGKAWGPKHDEKENFKYGGFRDPEDNEVWAVQIPARAP